MSGDDKIGDRVRITGATDFYQGEPELQVSKDGSGKDLVMLLGEGDPVEPAEGNAGGILNRSAEGKLVTRKGVVTGCETVNDRVRTILVRGADGKTARVFIDGCITAEQEQETKNLALGAESTVTGLASYDDTFNAPEGPFERIRSRADAVCGEVVEHVHDCVWTITRAPTCTEAGTKTRTCSVCGAKETAKIPARKLPATGDRAMRSLWAALLVLAAVAAAFLLGRKKRGK